MSSPCQKIDCYIVKCNNSYLFLSLFTSQFPSMPLHHTSQIFSLSNGTRCAWLSTNIFLVLIGFCFCVIYLPDVNYYFYWFYFFFSPLFFLFKRRTTNSRELHFFACYYLFIRISFYIYLSSCISTKRQRCNQAGLARF